MAPEFPNSPHVARLIFSLPKVLKRHFLNPRGVMSDPPVNEQRASPAGAHQAALRRGDTLQIPGKLVRNHRSQQLVWEETADNRDAGGRRRNAMFDGLTPESRFCL